MRDAVYDKLGVWMEYEMEILGVVPEDLAAQIAVTKPARRDEAALAPLRALMQKRR